VGVDSIQGFPKHMPNSPNHLPLVTYITRFPLPTCVNKMARWQKGHTGKYAGGGNNKSLRWM